jgi:hypothetical protein
VRVRATVTRRDRASAVHPRTEIRKIKPNA